MPLLIDRLLNIKTELHGNWYISRPMTPPFPVRLKDAWQVLIGNADAVVFAEQIVRTSNSDLSSHNDLPEP